MKKAKLQSLIAVSTATLVACTINKTTAVSSVAKSNSSIENLEETLNNHSNDYSQFIDSVTNKTSPMINTSNYSYNNKDISTIIDTTQTDSNNSIQISEIDTTPAAIIGRNLPATLEENNNNTSLESNNLLFYANAANASQEQTEYFVSANGTGDGTNNSNPISIRDLNEKTITSDTVIHFKKGDVFYDQLKLQTTSTTSPHITLDSYGTESSNPIFSQARLVKSSSAWHETATHNVWAINLDPSITDYDNLFGGTKGEYYENINNIGFIYDMEENKLYGKRCSSIDELKNSGTNFAFCPDSNNSKILYVYCDENPYDYIPNMCLALDKTILNIDSNTTISNLDFKFGGAHAIALKVVQNSNNNEFISCSGENIKIQNCNIDCIGGSYQSSTGYRLGNGIELLIFGSNVQILNNKISNCFDTATTLQGDNGFWNNVKISGNTFIHNSQAFEVWSSLDPDKPNYNDGAGHSMNNITFSNNICIEQGRGWGYDERPDKEKACDIMIKNMKFDNNHNNNAWSIKSTNNIFFNPIRLYYFDDSDDSFFNNIKANLTSSGNKIYLAPKSINSTLLHSTKSQYTYDYEKKYHDTKDSNYSYNEEMLTDLIDLNREYTETNTYWNWNLAGFQHFKQLGETFLTKYIDVLSSDTYETFATRYNKNSNDILYEISGSFLDDNPKYRIFDDSNNCNYDGNILASLKYVGNNNSYTKADFSFDDLPDDIKNKIFATSIKYPYKLVSSSNPSQYVYSDDITQFLKDSKIEFYIPDNCTNKSIVKDSQDYIIDVDTNSRTNYKWFKKNVNDDLDSFSFDSLEEIDSSNTNNKSSIIPCTSTTGTTYYLCVASSDNDDTGIRTAEIIKTVKVTVTDSLVPESPSDGDNTDPEQPSVPENPSSGGNTNTEESSSNNSSTKHHSSGRSSGSSSSDDSSKNTGNIVNTDELSYAYKFDPDLNSFIKIAIINNQTDVHMNSANADSNLSTTNNPTESYITYDKPQTALEDNNWNKINGNQWCYIKNGTPATGWIIIDNTKYHFNNKKIMDTGWIQDNNNWYYLNPNSDGTQGALQTGWIKDNNNWYYLDSSTGQNQGIMKTGWIQNNNNWYFLNPNGSMKTGWLYWNSKWYYLDSNGSMKTGWKKINNKWYYFYEDGSMASSTSINGYRLSNDGSLK